MPESARIRQSLEPLALPLLGIGLAHVLVGLIVLTLLPEIRKKNAAKTTTQLIWHSPADFLLDKTIKVEPEVVARQSPSAAAPEAPVMAPTAVSAPSLSLAQISPASTLAPVLQTNRGLTQYSDPRLLGASDMFLTINTVAPSITAKREPQAPVPPIMPEAPVRQEAVVEMPIPAVSTGEQKQANKYITLSVILPPNKAPAKLRENINALNLLDVANLNANERFEEAEAGGADMGPVEKSLQQAILKEWVAPPAQAVPTSQRRATMEISILRDGTITDASMKTASGSSVLDASIRKAADQLKKIPVTLPSNFPKERYELRVNFQIE